MREALRERMKKTNDPALEAFEKKDDPKALDTFITEQKVRTAKRHQ